MVGLEKIGEGQTTNEENGPGKIAKCSNLCNKSKNYSRSRSGKFGQSAEAETGGIKEKNKEGEKKEEMGERRK